MWWTRRGSTRGLKSLPPAAFLRLASRRPVRSLFVSRSTKETPTPTYGWYGHFFGGPEGDRTLDLCVANAALSQLSYEPLYTNIQVIIAKIHLKVKWEGKKIDLQPGKC